MEIDEPTFASVISRVNEKKSTLRKPRRKTITNKKRITLRSNFPMVVQRSLSKSSPHSSVLSLIKHFRLKWLTVCPRMVKRRAVKRRMR